jgi:hypothetical protein
MVIFLVFILVFIVIARGVLPGRSWSMSLSTFVILGHHVSDSLVTDFWF